MNKRLTWTDRLRIEQMLREGMTVIQIAARLRVARATIYYELHKGAYSHLNMDLTMETRYSADVAQQKTRQRAQSRGTGLKIGNNRALADYLEHLMAAKRYSPAAALAEAKKHPELGADLCRNTIYNYIRKGVFLRLRMSDLPYGSHRHRHQHVRASRAPRGESIERRPSEVRERTTFGHWEMDCVCGRQRTRRTLLVLTERLTRKEIIVPLDAHTSACVVRALDGIEREFGHEFRDVFRTITVDNGSEFSDVDGLERSFLCPGERRTRIYYCHPYCASERGSNENCNRIIRRWIPGGRDLSEFSDEYIAGVQEWINSYPRAVLSYLSADDLFGAYLASILPAKKIF